MEENKNQEEKIIYKNISQTDHYVKSSQKVWDFFLGFLGALILPSAYSFAYSLTSFIPVWVYFLTSMVILVALCVLFFKIGRRFIAIGIISMALIPLLIFGSCLLLLGGLGR